MFRTGGLSGSATLAVVPGFFYFTTAWYLLQSSHSPFLPWLLSECDRQSQKGTRQCVCVWGGCLFTAFLVELETRSTRSTFALRRGDTEEIYKQGEERLARQIRTALSEKNGMGVSTPTPSCQEARQRYKQIKQWMVRYWNVDNSGLVCLFF